MTTVTHDQPPPTPAAWTGTDSRPPITGLAKAARREARAGAHPGARARSGVGAPSGVGARDDRWTEVALGAALVAMVLVTGLVFSFSAAVMPNLAGADDHTFVTTMQRYNENPVFPITFTLALVVTAAAALVQRRQGPNPAVRWTVAALVLFAVVLVITAGLHFPLNAEIDQVVNLDNAAELADVRDRVEVPWVLGNIARTLLSTAAVLALGRAILLQGRTTAAQD